MRGKTKSRLGKPALSNLKLEGGKNEKPTRGIVHEKRQLYLYFTYSIEGSDFLDLINMEELEKKNK